MALRFTEETQTETGAWSASSSGISTDLLRNGVITEIRPTVELTPSATLGGANQPDGLWRVIHNLSIVGGSQTYITLPSKAAEPVGGTLLHYLNRYDGYGLGHPISVITAPQRTFTPITFIIHCGMRARDRYGRLNPQDLSAFIPTSPESRLRAVWTTGGDSVMDDTVNISSGTMRFTIAQWLGSEAEIRGEMEAQGVVLPPGARCMVPQWSAEVFSHTATASDYATERNLPTGGYLRRVVVVEQDETTTEGRGLRAGDEVTGVAIKLKDGSVLKRVTVEQMQANFPPANNVEADDAALDFGGFTANGIFVIDLASHIPASRHPHSEYGMYMGGRTGVGDVKLGLTITTYTSGDASAILYERVVPDLGLEGRPFA